MKEYLKYSKTHLSQLSGKHSVVFLSCLAACSGLLISTSLFSIYPEAFLNNLSTEQLFLMCTFYTAILAIGYIAPGLAFFIESSDWKKLSGGQKLKLAFICKAPIFKTAFKENNLTS
jgi:hypothetical protein